MPYLVISYCILSLELLPLVCGEGLPQVSKIHLFGSPYPWAEILLVRWGIMRICKNNGRYDAVGVVKTKNRSTAFVAESGRA